MELDKEKFESVLDLLKEGRMERETPSEEVIEWLKTENVHPDLIAFLTAHSYNFSTCFGRIYYNKFNELKVENLDDPESYLIECGKLIIGSCAYEDLIVIDKETGTMGFVDTQKLNGYYELDDILIEVPESFGEFYYKCLTDEDYPVDAYEAEEYAWELENQRNQ